MKQQANAEYDENKKHGKTIESKETSGVQKKQRSSIVSRLYKNASRKLRILTLKLKRGKLVCHLLQEGGKHAEREKVSDFRRSSLRACECKRA